MSIGNRLNTDSILNENHQLVSLNGQYKAVMQNDGRFAINVYKLYN